MKSWILGLSIIGILIGQTACSGGNRCGPYCGVRGPSPWWEHRDYYYDRVAVISPDRDDRTVAVRLPEPTPDVPAIGMPDIDVDGFD